MAAPHKKTPQSVTKTVLSVASESVPLVKTGGLADVVGALPAAMRNQGWQLRTLLPAYPGLADQLIKPSIGWSSNNLFGGPARVLVGKTNKDAGGLDMLLLDAPHLYARDGGIYHDVNGNDWPDNPLRFAALSQVGAEIAATGLKEGWRPGILHAHDWQAALAPAYLKYAGVKGIGTLVTIHNIAFQGLAPAHMVETLQLPPEHFTREGFEFWGQISTLKAGLFTADAISTVSPTYVQELTTPAYGMGLDGVIQARQDDLYGILNGVDLKTWDPRKDPEVLHHYGSQSLQDKAKNTLALTEEFGLTQSDGPLFSVVSRLTRQKGLDLLLEALPALLDAGGSLAVLGSGEAELEQGFLSAAKNHAGRVAVKIGYDEALSHRIYAGADVMMVPSRFEPCGLTQLYALRYGTLPLVAHTGGLADSVIDANDAALKAGVATGVQFSPVTRDALQSAIRRICRLYQQPDVWKRMQKRAMAHPVGWKDSAKSYAQLYQNLLK